MLFQLVDELLAMDQIDRRGAITRGLFRRRYRSLRAVDLKSSPPRTLDAAQQT
jgi:hypothetical protein